MTPHGPWTILAQRDVYRDPWIHVRVDDVLRPDGRPGIHSVITLKPGVTALALDERGMLWLTEEFHYAVGAVTLEGASGGCEPGEEPRTTAARELREELGIEAEDWLDLGTIDPFTANVYSPTRLFLGRKLRFAAAQPEGTEIIRTVALPLAEAVERVFRSEIRHAPTCVAILKVWILVLSNQLVLRESE
jgi:ADP-ribose pyrophosphatase